MKKKSLHILYFYDSSWWISVIQTPGSAAAPITGSVRYGKIAPPYHYICRTTCTHAVTHNMEIYSPCICQHGTKNTTLHFFGVPYSGIVGLQFCHLNKQYCMTTNCVFQPSSSLLNAGTTSYETRFNEKLQWDNYRFEHMATIWGAVYMRAASCTFIMTQHLLYKSLLHRPPKEIAGLIKMCLNKFKNPSSKIKHWFYGIRSN